MIRAAFVGFACAGLLAHAAPALAHAERSASTPEEGARVDDAPANLNITFTEPPTGDAVAEVIDGCGRDVVTDVKVQNFEIDAALASGQPGTWTVKTNVISGIDGHNTRDRWTFEVRGEPDCSAPESAPPEAGGGKEDDEDGGSIVPLVAIVGGTVALVAVGLVLRGRGS